MELKIKNLLTDHILLESVSKILTVKQSSPVLYILYKVEPKGE